MNNQRWERPLDFPPGFWKRQLPGKYLALARRGDVDGLRQLLADHPEFLNQRGSHNRTLLWEAARSGKLSAVKWLVEQGADVDALGCYNGESYVQITPYCAAIYSNRAAIADYLRPLSAELDIFRAAFMGDLAAVIHALDDDPTLLDAEDPHDPIYFVPLTAFAIAGGHANILDDLLGRGVPVERYSAQLLHLAARDARWDMIDALVNHGADVGAVDAGIFVNVSDLSIMRWLLDHGAPATQPGKNGFPPLVYLARGDKGEHPEKLQLLLDYGADVNAASVIGKTALHYAATAGHLRVMALLLAHGADVTLYDGQGATALNLARSAGQTEAVALLMRYGANE